MVDDLHKEKGGFEFTKLEYEKPPKPKLLNDNQDIKLQKEKPPVATLYGAPAPTQLKVTPLHKHGKLDFNYAAKLTEAGKTAILNSDANDAFKEAIRNTKTEEEKNNE